MPTALIPTARAFALLGLVSLLAIAGFVSPWLGGLALAFDALVLALVVVDGRRAAATVVEVRRELPAVLHQGEAAVLRLRLSTPAASNAAGRPVELRGREVLGPRLTEAPVDLSMVLRGTGVVDIPLVPLRRGEQRLAPLALRVLGPWGLCRAGREVDPGDTVRVFPRAHLEGEAGLLLRQALQRRTGANVVQRRGFSAELYALREYRAGDPQRSIHWKQTARRMAPVVREDAWEQHQHTLVLVDCGRPMAALAGVMSKLDHTLAVVLALVRVVLAQGDSATLVLFSKEVRAVVRVDRRGAGVAQAFEAVHALQADLEEPDYEGVVAWTARDLPRRSLALLCTSVGDLVGAETLGRAMVGLGRRHHPVLVNLEDPGLWAHARGVPEDLVGAYAKVSAMRLVHDNQALAGRLRAQGVEVVSSPADGLALAVLQRYLDLKARRRG